MELFIIFLVVKYHCDLNCHSLFYYVLTIIDLIAFDYLADLTIKLSEGLCELWPFSCMIVSFWGW